jgi:RNA polymerase sigma factor (sigma-70 family)
MGFAMFAVNSTDAELLERYLNNRDEIAFEAIVRKHGPMVLGACRRITAHHHDAEDAFQASFVVLAARAETVRPASQLGAWLHGVAVRCARKAYDARRRHRTIEPVPETDVLPSAIEPDLPAHLDAALAAIPETYRAAVVLCHLEGRTRSAAARELGWSEGTLSGRLHRAMELLSKRLHARGVTATGAALLAVVSARTASASLPTALAISTQTAVTLLSAGFGEPASSVASLAKGVMRTMMFQKVKLAAAVFLGVMGTGSFVVFNSADAKPTGEHRLVRRNAPVPEKKQVWKEVVSLKHKAEVSALAVLDGVIATGDADSAVRLWELSTGEKIRDLHVPDTAGVVGNKSITAVRLSPDGDTVYALANQDGPVLQEIARNEPKVSTRKVPGLIDLSSDGLTWTMKPPTATSDVQLRHHMWAKVDKKSFGLEVVDEQDRVEITHTALSADERWFATVTVDSDLRVYDRVKNDVWHKKVLHTIKLKDTPKFTALKLSDDGKRLAVIGENGFAKVFDAEAGQELCELKGHDGTVNAVAFTADGSQVATANGKLVRVFDTRSGKQLGEFKAHDDDITCLAFILDGKGLITGSKDRITKVWKR